jgi:hypothetical protein
MAPILTLFLFLILFLVVLFVVQFLLIELRHALVSVEVAFYVV